MQLKMKFHLLSLVLLQKVLLGLCSEEEWDMEPDESLSSDTEDLNFPSIPSDEHHERKRSARSTVVDDNSFIIDREYNKEHPPPVIAKGTPVKFAVLIFSVRGINEIEQEVTVEMRLQIWWLDSRLSNWKTHISPGKKYVSITHDISRNIWHPDIFIDYVKEIKQPQLLGSPPQSLRLYQTGFFRISTRVTIRMACPMAFHYYPVDKQECNIDMKSYAHTHDILALQWDHGSNNLSLLKPGMDLPNFELGLAAPINPVVETNSENYYSSIRFTVLLKRKLSYHFIQTYIPSSLFVVISWLSFLVPPESVPGRMAICMTTLLSVATMFSGIRQSIPKVSYIKALDIWMVACIVFVFLTLFEYAAILKLRSLIPNEEAKQKLKVRKGSESSEKGNTRNNSESQPDAPPIYNKYADSVRIAEKYSWMVCIILFVIFNCVYWPWLLASAGYYDKHGEDLFYKTK